MLEAHQPSISASNTGNTEPAGQQTERGACALSNTIMMYMTILFQVGHVKLRNYAAPRSTARERYARKAVRLSKSTSRDVSDTAAPLKADPNSLYTGWVEKHMYVRKERIP